VIRLIESIPATFWGVVAGSLFTFLGVWLSNRAQDRRLRQQLDHDRDVKSRERELTLRRDVYLPAIEGVWSGLEILGRIGNLSEEAHEIWERWGKVGPSAARASLIANESTSAAMSRFQTALSSKALALMAERSRVEAEETEMKFWMEEIKQLQAISAKDVSRWEQQRTEKSVPDPARRDEEYMRFEERRRDEEFMRFEERSSRVTALLESHGQRNTEVFEKKMQLVEKCTEAMAEVSELVGPVVGTMRAELDLPFDALAFSKLVAATQAKAKEDVRTYLTALHAIADDKAPSTHAGSTPRSATNHDA
jgi:hypothetical protein